MKRDDGANRLLEPVVRDLISDTIDLSQDYAEMGLDSFLDPGLLKEIPMVGTALKLGGWFMKVRELHMLRNYRTFLTALRRDELTDKKLKEHMQKLEDNPDNMRKEIELLLNYLQAYREVKKAEYMANVYRAFLKGGISGISWDTATVFFALLERILPQDLSVLKTVHERGAGREVFSDHSALLRLSALGLLQYFNGREETCGNKMSLAKVTVQGEAFYRAILYSKLI